MFQLTPFGRHVFELHQQLHSHIEHNVRNFLRRYDLKQMQFLVQCMKDTSEASWVQGDSFEDEADTTADSQDVPQTPDRVSHEAVQISEILSMLQQLDTRKLKKAKKLIQVAFLEGEE